MFDLVLLLQSLPFLMAGLLSTVALTASSLSIGFVIAVAVCIMQLSTNSYLRRLGDGYISVFRGVPLLIQLLFIYNFLPRIGLTTSPIIAAVAGLSLCTSAYQAEILRGGFLAIPKGQREAARMLGLSSWAILKRIEVPQVVRLTSPSLVNEIILMVKASSLVSVVGIAELTRTSQNFAASTFLQLQFYLAAAALYCVLNVSLSFIANQLETRTRGTVA